MSLKQVNTKSRPEHLCVLAMLHAKRGSIEKGLVYVIMSRFAQTHPQPKSDGALFDMMRAPSGAYHKVKGRQFKRVKVKSAQRMP